MSSRGVLELSGLGQGVPGVPGGLQVPGLGWMVQEQAGMLCSLSLCVSVPLAASHPPSFLTRHLSPDGAAAAGGPRVAPGS